MAYPSSGVAAQLFRLAMWAFLNERFEEILGSILLAIMVSIAFINVIVRYCTSFSFAWTEEITINFFVWITLLGTALAFRDGSNLAMSIVYQSFPAKLRKYCYWIGYLICLLFFGMLVYTGTLEVKDEYELESISESLGVPVWWYTIATPALSLLVILRMTQRFYQVLSSTRY